MYITKKDLDAIHAALDFVSSNTGSAEDREYWDTHLTDLNALFRKIRKQYHNQRFRAEVKKNVHKLSKPFLNEKD